MSERDDFVAAIERAQTVYRLGKYPSTQAEAIARHYLSLHLTAQFLQSLVEQQRYTDKPQDLQDVIDSTVVRIKEAHLRDLGIALEWPQPS